MRQVETCHKGNQIIDWTLYRARDLKGDCEDVEVTPARSGIDYAARTIPHADVAERLRNQRSVSQLVKASSGDVVDKNVVPCACIGFKNNQVAGNTDIPLVARNRDVCFRATQNWLIVDVCLTTSS